MPLSGAQAHGNLMSYKVYVRPEAHRVYGYGGAKARTVHQKNVHGLLHILFVHGECTTWDMAKIRLRGVAAVREQEKIYRRLLIGRTDRAKRSGGVLDVGLVTRQEGGTKPYSRYRLSPHGILYCLDALEPDRRDIDRMAAKYADLFPRLFGRWRALKRILGADAYNLRILSKGVYLNNVMVARSDNPLYELMSFMHAKYRRNFESMTERDLAEQISCWFYTFLLYRRSGKLKTVLAHDPELRKWYRDFFSQAKKYYAERHRTMRNSTIV